MRICLDFDHTLFMNDYPNVGNPVPHAIDAVRTLKSEGHYIIVASGRANRSERSGPDRKLGIWRMVHALRVHGVPYDEIDDGSQGKILADLYVDDKSLGAPLTVFENKYVIDWYVAIPMIEHLVALRERNGDG
jgi:hypothetical protein